MECIVPKFGAVEIYSNDFSRTPISKSAVRQDFFTNGKKANGDRIHPSFLSKILASISTLLIRPVAISNIP